MDRLQDLIISGRLGPDGKPFFDDKPDFDEFQYGPFGEPLVQDQPEPDVEVIDTGCGCGGT